MLGSREKSHVRINARQSEILEEFLRIRNVYFQPVPACVYLLLELQSG